jgi:hypothetical protein
LQIVDVLTQVQTTTREIQRSKVYGKKKLQKANSAAPGKDGGGHFGGDVGGLSEEDFEDDEEMAR